MLNIFLFIFYGINNDSLPLKKDSSINKKCFIGINF